MRVFAPLWSACEMGIELAGIRDLPLEGTRGITPEADYAVKASRGPSSL